MTEDDSQVKSRSALTIGFVAVVVAALLGIKMKSDLESFGHWFMSVHPLWFWPLYLLALALVFLVLYTVFCHDPKRIREPLQIPHTIDPYPIAYLRGGDTEVIRTAMVELVAAGKIVEHVPPPIQPRKSLFNWIIDSPIDNSNQREKSNDNWIANRDNANSESTPKIHQVILRHFVAPQGASSVFCNDVYSAVHSINEPYANWIQAEGLWDRQYRSSRWLPGLVYGSSLGFVALGILKAQKDFPTGTGNPEWHPFFTMIVMIMGMVFIVLLESRPKSTRGQQYLKDVERAFASLKNDPNTPVGTLAVLFGPTAVSLDSVKRIVYQWEVDANSE
jgi:uncharacterized protein (TIGR04222 family)